MNDTCEMLKFMLCSAVEFVGHWRQMDCTHVCSICSLYLRVYKSQSAIQDNYLKNIFMVLQYNVIGTLLSPHTQTTNSLTFVLSGDGLTSKNLGILVKMQMFIFNASPLLLGLLWPTMIGIHFTSFVFVLKKQFILYIINTF